MSKIKIFSLGGLNENSKNMYVVEIDDNIFVFEAGLKYADEKFLGVDYIISDYSYIKDNIKKVRGIFISHPHSEQIGALTNIVEENGKQLLKIVAWYDNEVGYTAQMIRTMKLFM